MCCGAPAVSTTGADATPQALGIRLEPAAASPESSPVAHQGSAKTSQGKSPAAARSPMSQVQNQMSPMNLFGMPDLLNGKASAPQTIVQAPQGTPVGAQNTYASQNVYTYNAMASQNVIVRR